MLLDTYSSVIAKLETRESELWYAYQQAARDAEIAAKHLDKEEAEPYRRLARLAYVRHQKCMNTILDIHKEKLFEEARGT